MPALESFSIRLEPEHKDLIKATVQILRRPGGPDLLASFIEDNREPTKRPIWEVLTERLAKLEAFKDWERQRVLSLAASVREIREEMGHATPEESPQEALQDEDTIKHGQGRPRKFYEILRAARALDHLSQSDLAEMMGVTTTCIYNWESGKRNIPPGQRARLIAILHLEGISDDGEGNYFAPG